MLNRKKVRVSVDLEGELAEAFLKELGERIQQGGSSSKADLGRTLMAEGLRGRGYDVTAPETQWGGYKEASEDDQGQVLPELAGV